MSGVDFQQYTEELIKNILANCSRQKHDICELLKTFLDDLSEMNSEIFFALKAESLHHPALGFQKMSTFDESLAAMIVDCLDYVLRFKRDFLRGMSTAQVNKVCNVIMKMLQVN